MRAWIEILLLSRTEYFVVAALLVRAWIEIKLTLPTKLNPYAALLVRAWIEIPLMLHYLLLGLGRSPRESVD